MNTASKILPGADQRRSAPRSRVLLSGKLVFGASEFTTHCAVRDLTPAGARVRLSEGVIVCDPIWLIHIGAGVAYGATIVWRSAQDLGLAFGPEIDLKPPVDAPYRRLRRIWLDSPGG
jgi:hypothetical protein